MELKIQESKNITIIKTVAHKDLNFEDKDPISLTVSWRYKKLGKEKDHKRENIKIYHLLTIYWAWPTSYTRSLNQQGRKDKMWSVSKNTLVYKDYSAFCLLWWDWALTVSTVVMALMFNHLLEYRPLTTILNNETCMSVSGQSSFSIGGVLKTVNRLKI